MLHKERHVYRRRNRNEEIPLTTLNWDNQEGTFTYNDGRKKTLTNGFGGVSIRQFKPYPDISMIALAGNLVKGSDNFKTL